MHDTSGMESLTRGLFQELVLYDFLQFLHSILETQISLRGDNIID